jgi:hypothetical protein
MNCYSSSLIILDEDTDITDDESHIKSPASCIQADQCVLKGKEEDDLVPFAKSHPITHIPVVTTLILPCH